MDVEAVGHATDDVLEDLGLTKPGTELVSEPFVRQFQKHRKEVKLKKARKGVFLRHFSVERRKKRNLLRELFCHIH